MDSLNSGKNGVGIGRRRKLELKTHRDQHETRQIAAVDRLVRFRNTLSNFRDNQPHGLGQDGRRVRPGPRERQKRQHGISNGIACGERPQAEGRLDGRGNGRMIV